MSSVISQLSTNDGILLASLMYSIFDICSEWDSFSTCHRPLHKWLVTSFASVLLFRVVHLVGTKNMQDEGNGDFMLNLRQKGSFSKALVAFTWLVALPFFLLWTFLGTYWLYDTMKYSSDCLLLGSHLWFIVFWQVLSYIWILVHGALGVVAVIMERRLRGVEGNLRSVEDADTVARWGRVSTLPGYVSLTGGGGLTPAEISELSLATVGEDAPDTCSTSECPICLTDFVPGDSVRTLDSCTHTFHKSCIDLWLLRRADCPLCKRGVGHGACKASCGELRPGMQLSSVSI